MGSMIPTISFFDTQWIADDATRKIARTFEAYKWPNPPIITQGEVKQILESYWSLMAKQIIEAEQKREALCKKANDD